MAAAAFPDVVAAVFSVAEAALPSTQVVRGNDISDAVGDVVLVGVSSLDDAEFSSAGSFQQSMAGFGGVRVELGTVNGLVFARDGGSDQAAATAAACGYLVAIADAVRADPTLGLTGFNFVVAEMQSGDVAEAQNEDGASTVVAFVISYQIQIGI